MGTLEEREGFCLIRKSCVTVRTKNAEVTAPWLPGQKGCVHAAESSWGNDPGSPSDAELLPQAHGRPSRPSAWPGAVGATGPCPGARGSPR